MSKPSVLLIGASGETGKSILDGLLECGEFVNSSPIWARDRNRAYKAIEQNLIALVRPVLVNKGFFLELKQKGVGIRVGDATDGAESLASFLTGIDIVISAVDAHSQLD
jgi:putative NADH-flavin reductase